MKIELKGDLILNSKLHKAGDTVDVSPALLKRLNEMGLVAKKKGRETRNEKKAGNAGDKENKQ